VVVVLFVESRESAERHRRGGGVHVHRHPIQDVRGGGLRNFCDRLIVVRRRRIVARVGVAGS
jgi:hypothetical protein